MSIEEYGAKLKRHHDHAWEMGGHLTRSNVMFPRMPPHWEDIITIVAPKVLDLTPLHRESSQRSQGPPPIL